MAIGGFNGSDPAPTLAQFQAYVAAGEIHWVIGSGGGGLGQQNGGSSASSEIASLGRGEPSPPRRSAVPRSTT
ncbi:hypothetical protein GCM10025868_21240 [Angustibacter aerolatus]|uniref:Putative mannosyltransferase YkcA/B-like C-terminal domain-containing protein n=1 Tax=Angustibacter aerolatus TaxID=1162965 RepID=A0ABQ6JHN2_9ACTN|nr:hypothetical protein GCM10025868_21240 [Angustibacter aerolatus]